jgi:hypothetical protein
MVEGSEHHLESTDYEKEKDEDGQNIINGHYLETEVLSNNILVKIMVAKSLDTKRTNGE